METSPKYLRFQLKALIFTDINYGPFDTHGTTRMCQNLFVRKVRHEQDFWIVLTHMVKSYLRQVCQKVVTDVRDEEF